MKNFTNNFKQFTSRLSARWLIMALMLLVGTSGAWAAQPEKLYLVPNDNWNQASARFAAYFFGNGEEWVSMTKVAGETNLYEVTVPTKKVYPNVIFCRMNPSAAANNWNNKWNQTGDLSIPEDGKNKFTLPSKNEWDGFTTTWSTYTPPCNVTLSVSKDPNANIYLTSESVTLSATAENHTSITWKNGDTTLGTGDSYTYTQSEVGNVTIKAIAANTTCNTEQTIDLAFVNQKAIKITTNGNYYLYTWDGDNTEYTTSWPGIKGTQEGDFYVWTIETTKPINAILNKGKDQAQTANIESLQVGYEYHLEWNGNGNASVSTVNKKELPKPCTTVEDFHLTYTDPKYTYDGNTKTAEVKWADDGTNTDITIKYGSATTAPKNAGNYDLKVSTGAHGDLCASQEDISLGTFTINKKTPDVNDFVYTNQTVTYNGEKQSVGVKWKDGYEKTGVITTTYKQGDEVKDPINAGTYDVWVTSAASDNFYATNSAINKVTLTIDFAKITDVPSNFQLSETSYNYGEEAKPTVSLKQGSTLKQAGLGAITTKYYNSSDQEVANPTAVGTYTVKITMTAGNGYSAITEPTVVGTFEITCYKPINPTLSKTDVTRCNGEPKTKGTITITNYAQYPEGCVFYLDGNIVTPTNEGVIENVYFPTEDSKTYTVKVTNTCGSTIQESDETQIDIKATDAAPSIGDFEIKYNVSSVCSGTIVQLEATHVNGATYAWYKGNSQDAIEGATNRFYSPSITENSTYRVTVTKTSDGCSTTKEAITGTITAIPQADAPQITPNYMNVCGGDAFKLPNIDGVTWSLDGKTTTGSQPGIANNTDEAIIKIFKAVKEVDGCPSAPADYTVTVNPTPVITGESVAQPGKENAINLKLQDNLVADWSVNPTADLSYTTKSNSTAFSAETNDTYTITATTKEGCTATHEVTVADAFYVYMRQPKKGENAYDNFYYPTQNPTQGGDLFYKEYSSIPPAEGYTDYNQGGSAHDVILTDCDGYVWYGFKASDKLIDGTNYFTVHAPNKGGYGGYYTHTYLTQPGKMTSDIYYTMNENASGVSQGWYITKVSAPYAGPVVHASGSTTLGTDKFVALYVTDCSGKEIEYYQWYKDGEEYISKCEYTTKDGKKTGDAGETNNIRPTVAGNYSCTVTYEDGSTATSAAVPVTGTYSNSFTSNLPIIMVNTNGVGFPDCTNLNGQTASKNASTLKAKRSVDVIIKEGNNVIYDRKARMAYRGSSSLNFVKKSYAFCPGDANCGDKEKGEDYVKTAKLNMLGIGDAYDKDWVLYAAAADPSLMRNRLVFDSFKEMTGGWSVNSRYVELIVDGVYKGVYVFMDKITMNKNRVNVDEKTGFIVKFDKTDKEDRIGGYNGKIGDEKTFNTDNTGKYDIKTYDTYVDQLFEIEYPEKDDYPTGWSSRTTAIKNMFNNFEKALKEGNYTTVQQYIDYTSWADWFIISEYAKNVDAYRASCIFVYSGEPGAKIEARPLWDQELSFNNQASKGTNDKGCNSTTGLLIQHSNVYSDAFGAPFWFTGGGSDITGGLLSDPCFVQVVKERWEIHKTGALSQSKLQERISGYYNELADYDESTKTYAQKSAKTREADFWSGKSRGACDCSYDTGNATATGYSNKTIEESKATMDEWILDAKRRTGLSTAISGLTGTTMNIQVIPSSQEITPWEAATITINKSDGYDYTLENDLDGVSGVVVQENGNSITYRIPRPSDWGYGDGNDSREDITYTIKATLNVASGTMVCGSTAAPNSTATIILQDEEDENCDQ